NQHWNPGGTSFSQAERSRLRATGTVRLIPRTLALMTVQRHNAASRSTNPSSTAQHLLAGGVPITRWTSPPKRSAHAPSFNASFGHFAGGAGAGSLGGDLPQAQSVVTAAENAVKKRRLVMKKTAVNLLLITAAMAAAVESVLSGFFLGEVGWWVGVSGSGAVGVL
ncbi:unnamed protein product, partial [Linum tenue]